MGAQTLAFHDNNESLLKTKKYSCQNQICEKLRDLALRDIKKVFAAKVIFNSKPIWNILRKWKFFDDVPDILKNQPPNF